MSTVLAATISLCLLTAVPLIPAFILRYVRFVATGFILFMFSRDGHKYQRDDVSCWCRDGNAREDDGGSGQKTATIRRTATIALPRLKTGTAQKVMLSMLTEQQRQSDSNGTLVVGVVLRKAILVDETTMSATVVVQTEQQH